MGPCRFASFALILAFGAAVAPAQESAPAVGKKVRLALDAAAKDVLSEFTFVAKGKLDLSGDPARIDEKRAEKWLDHVDERAADGSFKDTRLFLDHQSMENGIIRDPGLSGVEFFAQRSPGKDSVVLGMLSARRALDATVKRIQKTTGFFGLRLPLPESAAVGESFPFVSKAFLETILSLDGRPGPSAGTVRLDKVDEEKAKAFCSATMTYVEDIEMGAVTTTVTYSVDLKIDVDLATSVPAKIDFKGKAVPKGRGAFEGRVSGDVAFEGRILGAAVRSTTSFREKRPVFRERPETIGPVEFKIPAAWLFASGDRQRDVQFVDSREESNTVHVTLQIVGDVGDPGNEVTQRQFLDGMRAVDPKTKLDKTGFPIGKGFLYTMTAADGSYIRGAIAPIQGSLAVILKFMGNEAAVKKLEAEFKTVHQSLKRSKDFE